MIDKIDAGALADHVNHRRTSTELTNPEMFEKTIPPAAASSVIAAWHEAVVKGEWAPGGGVR